MARTVLEFPGEDITIGGDFDVFGTTSGGEEITILTGSDVFLDPSFNRGGDTIRLPGEAEEYTARVEGSYVILESAINDVRVAIPVGPNGITVVFGGDDTRTIMFDSTDNRVEISGEGVDSSADPLSPGTDGPVQGQIYNLNPGSETIIGTEGDDRFRASNNELGAGDLIDGRGGNDRLEVFVDENAPGFGSINYSGFELNNVEQVLVTNDGTGPVTLDMSSSDDVQVVGSVNSSEDVEFEFVTTLADVLIDDITTGPGFTDIRVSYETAVTAGADDTVTVTIRDSAIDDVEIGTIDNTGSITFDDIEGINLVVDGDSSIQDLEVGMTDLTISGTGDIEIVQALDDTVRTINATGLAGNVTLDYSNNTVGVTYDGSAQVDDVTIGSGLEDISTNAGNDIVRAGSNFAGDDSAATGRQDDAIDFGAGTDTLTVNAGTVDLDYTNVSNLENLTLTSAGTTVLGAQAQEAGIVRVNGNAGNDVIVATAFTRGLIVAPGTGDDNVSTGSGNDTYIFNGTQLTDADILDANGGSADALNLSGDIFVTSAADIADFEVINLATDPTAGDSDYVIQTDAQYVSAPGGTLTVNGGGLAADEDVFLDAQTGDYAVDATTGAGNDVILTSAIAAYDDCVLSGAGSDFIITYDGDDDVSAGAGNDVVVGGLGDDDLHLGAGNDDAYANEGDDRIYGDLGADEIDLGTDNSFATDDSDLGADTVIYTNVNESGTTAAGRDTIYSFDSGEDTIDISELLANNGTTAANSEYIFGQDLDAAEAQMVAGDGVISFVFIETMPGEPTEVGDDRDGFFFVDLNDDGELGGEDLQLNVNGDNVAEGDVDTTLNASGESGFDVFIDEHCSTGHAAGLAAMESASFA